MKMRIAIFCALLAMWLALPVSVNAVEQVTGVGFAVDSEEGFADNVAMTAAQIPLGAGIFTLTGVSYQRTINNNEQSFGFDNMWGYKFNPKWQACIGFGVHKDESTEATYTDLIASGTYKFGLNAKDDQPLAFGLSPFAVYRAGQNTWWAGVVFKTFFGD